MVAIWAFSSYRLMESSWSAKNRAEGRSDEVFYGRWAKEDSWPLVFGWMRSAEFRFHFLWNGILYCQKSVAYRGERNTQSPATAYQGKAVTIYHPYNILTAGRYIERNRISNKLDFETKTSTDGFRIFTVNMVNISLKPLGENETQLTVLFILINFTRHQLLYKINPQDSMNHICPAPTSLIADLDVGS